MAAGRQVHQTRSFILVMRDGDSFMESLVAFCKANQIRSARLNFIGALRAADVIAECRKRSDAERPDLDARLSFEYLEVVGSGTVAFDAEKQEWLPHVHFSGGEIYERGEARTGHLVDGVVRFVIEMHIDELDIPMTRTPDRQVYDLPILDIGLSPE